MLQSERDWVLFPLTGVVEINGVLESALDLSHFQTAMIRLETQARNVRGAPLQVKSILESNGRCHFQSLRLDLRSHDTPRPKQDLILQLVDGF